MPYHLELGSEGHSFHGKAIVVNSQTGEHKSYHPIPMDDAKAQMRVLEGVAAHESAPEAPKKRRILLKKKPVAPEAPKAEEAKEKHWLTPYLQHYHEDDFKYMFSHHHTIPSHKISVFYAHKINKEFRPEGMLSGKIDVDKNIGIDFSPHQEFSIFAKAEYLKD